MDDVDNEIAQALIMNLKSLEREWEKFVETMQGKNVLDAKFDTNLEPFHIFLLQKLAMVGVHMKTMNEFIDITTRELDILKNELQFTVKGAKVVDGDKH